MPDIIKDYGLHEECQAINADDVIAILTIYEPREIPIIKGGKKTIGMCIDEMINSRTTRIELNLDKRNF